MSSNPGKLFRPGRNSVISQYTAAFAEETIYPHDWVALSITAPSSQGTAGDGVVDGQTLLASDHIYVALADAHATASLNMQGRQMGVSMGSTLNSVVNVRDVSTHSTAADELLIIQRWGVHPSAQTDGSALIRYVLNMSTTAGSSDPAIRGTTGIGIETVMGMALATDFAYTRAAAATGALSFVRCNL